MSTMREIKRRIRSVENTKKITSAQKMVAAAKLRRAQEAAEAARPYAEKMRDVINSLAQGTKSNHPMLVSRPIKKTGYLIITSDRGLCGGYNANLLRMLEKLLKERHQSKDDYVLFVIGRKGLTYLTKKGYPVLGSVTGLSDSPSFGDIKEVASQAVGYFEQEKYDELYLVYNQFINPVVQRPVDKRILPLDSKELASEKKGPSAAYEFEPSQEEVLAEILPRYAESLVYSALMDAKASEFAAKMTAMTSATDNATELISQLTLEYNKARQAAITQEISEIVAGANALQ
jgi:F-type H+-transporting ATPase subunit gamma